MIIFIVSIVTALIGAGLGAAIGQAELFMYFGGIIGLTLPYAIVLEKMFKTVCKGNTNKLF